MSLAILNGVQRSLLQNGLRLSHNAYSVPLTNPFSVEGKSIRHREGLIVIATAHDGSAGVGDICPLPGLHIESTDDCIAELDRLNTRWSELLDDVDHLRGIVDFVDHLIMNVSAVTTNGVQQALFHLLSRVSDVPLSLLIQSVFIDELGVEVRPLEDAVYMNGVLPRRAPAHDSGGEHAFDYVSFVSTSPFDTLKLKVGAVADVKDDAEHTRLAVQAAIQQNRSVRLDANRAWTASQFEDFINDLGHHVVHIEFIEEPLKTWQQLQEYFANRPGGPSIGLDESLVDSPGDVIMELAEHASALVLKPAVLGSMRRILQLVSLAEKTGCDVILSTCFESGLGTAWNTVLAAVCDSIKSIGMRRCSSVRHGLGTFAYLQEDVLKWSFSKQCVQEDRKSVSVQATLEIMETVLLSHQSNSK